MGATGDGGHFDQFADLLADEFMVITYDRRGNGRSPAWRARQTTSVEEQADDAAALLDRLGSVPRRCSCAARNESGCFCDLDVDALAERRKPGVRLLCTAYSAAARRDRGVQNSPW